MLPMFKKITTDLNIILDSAVEERLATGRSSKSFVDAFEYLTNISFFTRWLFYCCTFIKNRGKELRQCYIPIFLFRRLQARLIWSRIRKTFGI